jgi:inner membrane protein
VLPDLDVIGFSLGVSYGDFLGHRGFSHSLFFAFLLSSTVMLLAFRKPPVFSKKWWLIWLFFFGVSSSHGILDAFTNGGLGIALLSPFNTNRYFFPWRPLVLAPIEIRALFTPLGKEMLLSELYWIWLPLILALIIAKAYRKIKLRNHNKTRKAECQSVELAKNVSKRLFLALLVLLLIAGLVFQAPWKLITLLLIVLAACTVLPKPYRKWFWLSAAAAIVVVLIIWIFLPEDSEGWQPYTFDEELAALQAKYAIPDSENAATIYNQLLEDFNDTSYYGNLPKEVQRKLLIREPWSDQEHPELVKWLKSHQDTITTLIEASKVEKCRFPIYAYFANFSRSNEHRSAFRRWTFLLTTAANNDLGEGRADEALEKYMAVLQMGKHWCQQPTTMDILVGMSIEALALRGFKTFVVNGDATEQQLDAIEQAVADFKHDWISDRLGILEYEKLMAKNRLGEYYERDLSGRIRLSHDPKARIRECMRDFLEGLSKEEGMKYRLRLWINPNYWQRKLIRARTILYWFYLPSKPQKGAEIIDALYEKYYKRAGADFDWKKEPEEISPGFRLNFTYLIVHLVVGSSAASNYRFHDIYLRVNASNRGSRLIVALRRYKNEHGRWPETLDGIKNLVPGEIFVDPINDSSLVYKLTDDGFKLYSKGKNNIDEGGRPDRESGADDWLIWSRKTRKTKNEKADTEQSNTQKGVVK